jgi:hypothetical protein
MLDVDVEMVDYSSVRISPNANYDAENKEISDIMKAAINVKGGVEFHAGPVYLRGGAAYYGNPYNKDKIDASVRNTLKGTVSYSAGIGFRSRDFYMDAAYSYMRYPERINNLYLSYNKDSEWYEQAKIRTVSGKVVVTFGVKF